MSPVFVTVTALVTLVTRAACFSPRAPVITSQPRSLRAPLSDGVTLACTVEHLGALVVVWKHGEEVVTAGSMMVSPDPRYRYIAVQYSSVQYSIVQHDGQPGPQIQVRMLFVMIVIVILEADGQYLSVAKCLLLFYHFAAFTYFSCLVVSDLRDP